MLYVKALQSNYLPSCLNPVLISISWNIHGIYQRVCVKGGLYIRFRCDCVWDWVWKCG